MPASDSAGKPAKVTRDDVAHRAGVSPAVVSYVLSGSKHTVAATTAERVRRAAADLGYRPNRLARGLRAGRSTFVGMITPDSTNPFFAMLLQAVENAAFARDHIVLMGSSEQDLARERHYLEAFAGLNVAGILLVSCARQADHPHHVEELARHGIPVVLLDRICATAHGAAVLVDNMAGTSAATHHLLAHGRERLAFVTGPEEASTAAERLAGYIAALEETDRRSEPERVLYGEFSRASGRAAANHLLHHPNPPDGIVAASDQQAIGVLQACHQLGVRVPEELAVIGFDDTPEAAFTVPSLSTVSQPLSALAEAALDVVTRASPPPSDGAPIRIPVELRPRESCGCPNSGREED